MAAPAYARSLPGMAGRDPKERKSGNTGSVKGGSGGRETMLKRPFPGSPECAGNEQDRDNEHHNVRLPRQDERAPLRQAAPRWGDLHQDLHSPLQPTTAPPHKPPSCATSGSHVHHHRPLEAAGRTAGAATPDHGAVRAARAAATTSGPGSLLDARDTAAAGTPTSGQRHPRATSGQRHPRDRPAGRAGYPALGETPAPRRAWRLYGGDTQLRR
jgi:hypothetical protein